MAAYYNEFDPHAAQWLRRLIKASELPAGDVDERDIRNLTPNDFKSYTQCHFFAGIGGWPLALRHAGWTEDRPVWTGSCPCQPKVIFGEQVASKTALEWLDLVWADLEASGYAIGAADICAAGVAAPHIRQRLWFGAALPGMADANGPCIQGRTPKLGKVSRVAEEGATIGSGRSSPSDQTHWKSAQWLECRDNVYRSAEPSTLPMADGVPGDLGRLRAYGNAIVPQVAAEFISAFDHAVTDCK